MDGWSVWEVHFGSEHRWAVVRLRVVCAESWVLMAQSQVEVRSIVVGVRLFGIKGLLSSPGVL